MLKHFLLPLFDRVKCWYLSLKINPSEEDAQYLLWGPYTREKKERFAEKLLQKNISNDILVEIIRTNVGDTIKDRAAIRLMKHDPTPDQIVLISTYSRDLSKRALEALITMETSNEHLEHLIINSSNMFDKWNLCYGINEQAARLILRREPSNDQLRSVIFYVGDSSLRLEAWGMLKSRALSNGELILIIRHKHMPKIAREALGLLKSPTIDDLMYIVSECPCTPDDVRIEAGRKILSHTKVECSHIGAVLINHPELTEEAWDRFLQKDPSTKDFCELLRYGTREFIFFGSLFGSQQPEIILRIADTILERDPNIEELVVVAECVKIYRERVWGKILEKKPPQNFFQELQRKSSELSGLALEVLNS